MIIECKSCGSEIEVEEGQITVVCGFCGMEQTIPKMESAEKLEEFQKANEDRRNNKFDVAKAKYRELIAKYPDDNEAYWCKLLCEYGIEYVEDFATEKKIPTCHLTVRESIFDNDDYKLVISRATPEEKAIYESEAKEIDRIQKEILEKVDKESPYDIFICYKESKYMGKNNGATNREERTEDSRQANKIYKYLTDAGYKVFFSRETLHNKAGEEYEPIIYSALYTAKVMLLVTTSSDYVNAAWVRNEWSRFLGFMEKDVTKTLIPCLYQMRANVLPKEISRFQAMEIESSDFWESLSEIMERKFNRIHQNGFTIHSYQGSGLSAEQNKTVANNLNYVKLIVVSGDWKNSAEAKRRLAEVENIDVNNAYIYFYRLCLEYKVGVDVDELAKCDGVTTNPEFIKARSLTERGFEEKSSADKQLKSLLDEVQKGANYYKALSYAQDLSVKENYTKTAEYLQKAKGYKDADEFLSLLPAKREEQEKKKKYCKALEIMDGDIVDAKNYELAIKYLKEAGGYGDSVQLIKELPQKRNQKIKEAKYKEALLLTDGDITDKTNYEAARKLLLSAEGYPDADELLKKLPTLRAEQFQAKALDEKKYNYDAASKLLQQNFSDNAVYKKAREHIKLANGYPGVDDLSNEIEQKRKNDVEEKKADALLLKIEKAKEKRDRNSEKISRTFEFFGNLDPVLKGALITLAVGIVVLGVGALIFWLFQIGFSWQTLQIPIGIYVALFIVALSVVTFVTSESSESELDSPIITAAIIVLFSFVNVLVAYFVGSEYMTTAWVVSIPLCILAVVFSFIMMYAGYAKSSILTSVGVVFPAIAVACTMGWSFETQWVIVLWGIPALFFAVGFLCFYLHVEHDFNVNIIIIILLVIGFVFSFFISFGALGNATVLASGFTLCSSILSFVLCAKDIGASGFYKASGIAYIILFAIASGFVSGFFSCLGC